MNSLSLKTRAAIWDLNARFSWALDHHDYESLRDVLARDVHYRGSGGDFAGVESVIHSFLSRNGQSRTTRHGMGNLLLTPRSDGTITGLSCWHTFASNVEPPTGIGLSLVADFHDIYRKGDNGQWRIGERIITPIFREPSLAPGVAQAVERELRS